MLRVYFCGRLIVAKIRYIQKKKKLIFNSYPYTYNTINILIYFVVTHKKSIEAQMHNDI